MLLNVVKTSIYYSYRLCRVACILSLIAAVVFQLQASHAPTIMDRIQTSGKIVVASRNGPTTYYEQEEGFSGFEYVLAAEFANYLGVELEMREIDDLGELLQATKQREVHVAAAGLAQTPKREKSLEFSLPYMQVKHELIYKANTKRPRKIEDIIGREIVVMANSAHAETLRELKKSHPDLSWEERYDLQMIDLLEQVHQGQIDFVVVDSHSLELNSGLYPKAKRAFTLAEERNLAWAMTKAGDKSLAKAANRFLKEITESGHLNDIKLSFYGHLGQIQYSDALVFTRRVNERLPKWEGLLKEAAEETDLDWKLLAALSYQESHWNPRAKSPTGVRGFMMLTLNTAKEMKVKSRLNAKQSISGGSRYFKKLNRRLPSHIQGKDRTWLTLAAYNVGYGHMEDARRLTLQHGDNPDKWTDVKKYLPLLAKRQYYKHTRHGYARGWEAVTYVENIRNFHNILAWREVKEQELEMMAQRERERKQSVFDSHLSSAIQELTQAEPIQAELSQTTAL